MKLISENIVLSKLLSFVIITFTIVLFNGCKNDSADTREVTELPVDALYHSIAATQSKVDFVNQLTDTEEFNIVEYLYYYNGGGVAIGDINNDNLPDLYFTANRLSNQLYLNQGNFKFKNITESAGVGGVGDWKTGVTMADINADGWLDIYVCQVGKYKTVAGKNQLFINQQDGTFTEQAADYGLDFVGFSTQAAFFDYDLDGDLDMFLLNHSVHAPENYSNTEMRTVRNEWTGDRLYRNDGNTFTDVTETSGIYSTQISYGLDVSVSDLNQDGCPDLYISNDFHENDYLYYNNCDGTFREGITTSMGHTTTFSMGNDIADLNNDLLPDVLSLDMKPADEIVLKNSAGADPFNIYQYKLKFGYHYQYPRNALQWNRGNLTGKDAQFSEIGQLAKVAATDWSWSILLHDMDNDGRKDAFITNGIWQRPNDLDYQKFISNRGRQASASNLELVEPMPSGIVKNYAFRNSTKEGVPDFEDTSFTWGLDLKGCSNGAAYADLDNDGDLDLVVNNLNAIASIYENKANLKEHSNYLKIKLLGEGGNPYGVGATVTITSDVNEQIQEHYVNRGFQSSVAYGLHFGLDTVEVIDKLVVKWISGKTQIIENIVANQTLVLKEIDAIENNSTASVKRLILNKIEDDFGIDFVHQEDPFIDFDNEKLLLHKLSTEGANITIGDLNNDGLLDIHIGGARKQAGAIFMQKTNGEFRKKDSKFLELDAHHEDVAAAIFDADNDGDNDLYIVSGGGQWTGAAVADRLYLNDKDNFTKSENALPQMYTNGAFVLAEDFNGDNFTDLLIGSRSVVGKYGLSPQHYLLINDGKGVFVEQTETFLPNFANLGMLTDAVVLDKNETGIQQFAVVGEWLPITIFTKKGNTFVKKELPNSTGWWQTVAATDFDADGDLDLFVGNQGLNLDLHPTIEQPIELYIKDFDTNGSTDPILTYYKQDKKYTYASKDELISQIVILRKRFNDYNSFAQSNFAAIFSEEQLEDATYRKAEHFASVYVENLQDENFKITNLPLEMQIAPLQGFAFADINQDGRKDVLAVGNFYGNQPNIGRSDASYGHVLVGNGKGDFEIMDAQQSGFVVTGEARDIEVLELGNGKNIIVISRNDDAVEVFGFN